MEKPSIEAAAGIDPSWSDLYRAGGIAAILFALLSIANAGFVLILPPPPSSGGIATLEYITANRPGYIIFQALLVGPVVLAGRATIEAVLQLSAEQVAGPRTPGQRRTGLLWHGRQTTT